MLDMCKAIGFSRPDFITSILDSMKFLTSDNVFENFEKIERANRLKRNKLFHAEYQIKVNTRILFNFF